MRCGQPNDMPKSPEDDFGRRGTHRASPMELKNLPSQPVSLRVLGLGLASALMQATKHITHIPMVLGNICGGVLSSGHQSNICKYFIYMKFCFNFLMIRTNAKF